MDRGIYWFYKWYRVLFQSVGQGACVYFSVENSFLKVSWCNFLDAHGNRAGFYGIFFLHKKKFKMYGMPLFNEINIGYFGHHSENSDHNKTYYKRRYLVVVYFFLN